MGKPKRSIELIANNTGEAIKLKEALTERGFNVNHIYTGSSLPITIEKGYVLVGAGNIRANYLTKDKD
jgi:hypothetical protein